MSGERERKSRQASGMIRGRIASVGATTSMNTVFAWSLRMWRKKIPWPYDKLEYHVYFLIKVNFVLDEN